MRRHPRPINPEKLLRDNFWLRVQRGILGIGIVALLINSVEVKVDFNVIHKDIYKD